MAIPIAAAAAAKAAGTIGLQYTTASGKASIAAFAHQGVYGAVGRLGQTTVGGYATKAGAFGGRIAHGRTTAAAHRTATGLWTGIAGAGTNVASVAQGAQGLKVGIKIAQIPNAADWAAKAKKHLGDRTVRVASRGGRTWVEAHMRDGVQVSGYWRKA
jgi:hypothetical protein